MAEEEEVVGATCVHHLNLYRTGPDRRSLSEARRKEARVFGEVSLSVSLSLSLSQIRSVWLAAILKIYLNIFIIISIVF